LGQLSITSLNSHLWKLTPAQDMVRNKRSLIIMKGVDLAFRRADNPDCDRAFDETARAIYESVASRPCPSSVRFE